MEFREISDGEWELIRLPPRARNGRPRVNDRRVLNGILYVLITGCRWMDMHYNYGHYSTSGGLRDGWRWVFGGKYLTP
ncbi:MAG: transposase [Thermoproteota archaeon]